MGASIPLSRPCTFRKKFRAIFLLPGDIWFTKCMGRFFCRNKRSTGRNVIARHDTSANSAILNACRLGVVVDFWVPRDAEVRASKNHQTFSPGQVFWSVVNSPAIRGVASG